MTITLPIASVFEDLRAALSLQGMAVLQAPPGAGKTTGVPLDLLASGIVTGRILMLEPRRLAARGAADRMANVLGEPVGQTVGYRMRGDAKVSAQTRIEVVTEGILTRMIQSDPELSGTGLAIFDEFHERSLNADLGLALCLEVRTALRDDLKLLVMSATLDAAPVARMLGDAPIITSEGVSFPVETRWLPRPMDASLRYEAAVAGLVREAVDETEGGILVFLPGEAEIRRVQSLLSGLEECTICPLFGAMEFSAQRAALGPVEGRRVVLATSIAETSLTIPDIRVVIDGGRARRARFDPASGMSRLVTERVTRAEADQRRGRAGRVAPGLCYRLWTKGEEGGMALHPPAEIESADLTSLALELKLWGDSNLSFLTPPNAGVMAEADALLTALGALENGRITEHGRRLSALPLHPRLGHMLLIAGKDATPLAALLAERDPLRTAGPELALRLTALTRPPPEADRAAIDRIRAEAKRLERGLPPAQIAGLSAAQMAALAYPDRVGLRRKGEAPRWVLSGGKGASMGLGNALSNARLIVATDLDGDPREATIRQAIAISEAELRELFANKITWNEVCEWSRREGRVISRRQECFGALVLDDRTWPDAPPTALAQAALEGIRFLGLPMGEGARRLQARIELARGKSADWPDCSDAGLLATAKDWLLPYLDRVKTESDIRNLDLTEAIRSQLTWEQTQVLDQLAPAHFETPLGRKIPIDYAGEAPSIEVRLQEMFGVTVHPTVGLNRRPLRVTLLSPAQRPVQVTMDLPGFWANTYADVRRDMRGAYPRHPWPEDPTAAEPTLRAKPRGT